MYKIAVNTMALDGKLPAGDALGHVQRQFCQSGA